MAKFFAYSGPSAKDNLHVTRISLICCMASLTLLAACAGDQAIGPESRTISVDQSAIPASASPGQDTGVLAAAISATTPSFVTLTISTREGGGLTTSPNAATTPLTSGSGFVVSGDGYVVTAAHVAVAKGNDVEARAANGRIYSGSVIAINPANDLALIKLRVFNGNATVPAGPACTQIGGLLYTLGKPHGMGDTVRVGTLQAMHFGRPVSYGSYGYPDAIVLHMNTQRGESGGPVFNAQGQLIGMVVSTLSNAQGESITMAHAIPANTIGKFLCGAETCSPQWAAIAAKPVDSCG